MNHTTSILILNTILLGMFTFAIWCNIHAYAQQLSSPPSYSSATTTTSMPRSSAKPEQHITKVKITSPTKGQQLPVGKDLTISGISIDKVTVSSTDCKVSVIANKVRPYQPATANGTGGIADYSKWKFVLTSKYTTIKPGENKITAKYECGNNAASTSFSSVNVTGVATNGSTATATNNTSSTTTTRATTTKGDDITNSANTTTPTKPTTTTSPHAQTTKMATAAKAFTNASTVSESLSLPNVSAQSSITKTATTTATDQKSQQQHIPIRANSNYRPSPATNSTEPTGTTIPISKTSNDPIASTIAPQVKLIPQQNTKSQPQQQQQLSYQQATENANHNTLKLLASNLDKLKPLTNLASSDMQTNESSHLRYPSGQPSENQSKSGLLSVSIKVGGDPIIVGNKQNVLVLVSDATSNEKVAGAKVVGQVMNPSGLLRKGFQAQTDDNGQVSYTWKIKQTGNAPDTYNVVVTILAPGYHEQTAAISFTVNPPMSRNPIESPFNSNDAVDDNNSSLHGNRIHDFTNKILDDVKQNIKDKWIPRHFILPTPF